MIRYLSFLGALALAFTPLVSSADEDVGIQLWSLRDTFKEDVSKGLQQAKDLGFKEVETAGTYDMTPKAFKDLLDKHDLKATSAHFQYERLQKDLKGAIQEAKELGVDFVAVPWIPHKEFTEAQARTVAAEFNTWGAAFREEGIKFAYHPHGFEFKPNAQGKTPFDVLVEETDAKNVSFQMDVFWIVHSGNDPIAMIKKHPKRWSMMHIKDIRKGAVTGLFTGGAPATDNVPAGTGQVDWANLLKEAKKADVKHYYVEDESPAPVANIPVTLKFLKTLDFSP